MRRPILLAIVLTIAAPPATRLAAQQPDRLWDEARLAWDGGDYPASLRAQLALLAGPAAADYLERIAVLTGEPYEVREVAPDGRNARWSPDGLWIVYETMADGAVSTHLVRAEDARAAPAVGITRTPVPGAPAREQGEAGIQAAMKFAGAGLAFSPDGSRIAYVGTEGAVAHTIGSRGQEVLPLEGLVPIEVAAGPDATYVLATERSGSREADVYAVRQGEDPRRLTRVSADRSRLRVLPDGQVLVAVRDLRLHVPRPPPPNRFELIDPATGDVREHHGTEPAISADGSTLVYLASTSDWNEVNLIDLATGEQRGVLNTDLPLAAPALSADGQTIVLQEMPVHDWELVTMSAIDGAPQRITNEIQHDLFPRFLNDGTVLAVKGEGRHRRSFLYDPVTGDATRIFHNNTVRTIAPEYEWAVSPDGRRILIVAERDGDTVSPERGVYLVDLDRRVTVDDVRARVTAMLAEEESLRERGARMFAPLAERVRGRTDAVSISRLYEYQREMYGFGSKYITQPGNRAASAYLFETLRSFGYEPEYQWFDAEDRRTGETVRTANVIATLRGTTDPELVYVVSSHFDSVERGPGADDNTSGTSALLETARVLAEHPLPATVQLAFFTGEEAGLLGSREYVRRAVADGVRIVGALNNDMIGWSGDHRLDNTIRYSNTGIRDLQHAAALGFSELITYDALYYKNTDAHAYFEVYGDIVGGIGSYPVLANPHYHQATDRIETMNHELIRETARTNIASLMLLASSPSRVADVEAATTPRGLLVTWTASPESTVTGYEVVYGPGSEPERHRLRVREPRAALPEAGAGWSIAVRAVTSGGLHGWDWGRAGWHVQ